MVFTPLATYCDQGHHRNNKEVPDFFFFLKRGVSLVFSPSGPPELHKALKWSWGEMLRKNGEHWET